MKDYSIGYRKTDPKTRWKPGQCGNPHRKRRQQIPSVAAMIDDVFAKMVTVKERGRRRRLTTFEVILLRLLPEIGHGNRRAIRIRKKYQAYAQAHPTVVYEPAVNPEDAAAQFETFLEELAQGPVTKEQAEYDKAYSKLTLIEAAEAYNELLKSINEQWEPDYGE